MLCPTLEHADASKQRASASELLLELACKKHVSILCPEINATRLQIAGVWVEDDKGDKIN